MQNDNFLTAIKAALNIHRPSLEQLINQQVDQAIAKMPPQQLDFGQVSVDKKGILTLDIKEQTIYLSIPLKIHFKGKSLLSLVKAHGEIELFLETALTFQEDWQLFTVTKLVRYRWVEEPDLQLSVFNLSVEKIADQFLHRFKEKLEIKIDESIQKGWNTAKVKEKTAAFFAKAHQLNPQFPIYLHLLPERFQLSPVESDDLFLRTQIDTVLGIELNSSDKGYENIKVPTPSFEKTESDQESYFNVNVDLKYPPLEQLMKTQLIGQSVSYKDYEITFSDVQLSKVEKGLQLIVGVEGYMKGNINLVCLPIYDEIANVINMQIIDFELNVDSFWKRNLASLFSGVIKEEMQKRLRFKLDDILQLKEVKNLEDFNPQKEAHVSIKISDIRLRNFIVGEEAISCTLVAAASIALTLLEDLKSEKETIFS
ncbi:MAG: DUF4403 family protein [Saprospiraceae bacterium]